MDQSETSERQSKAPSGVAQWLSRFAGFNLSTVCINLESSPATELAPGLALALAGVANQLAQKEKKRTAKNFAGSREGVSRTESALGLLLETAIRRDGRSANLAFKLEISKPRMARTVGTMCDLDFCFLYCRANEFPDDLRL